MQTITLPERCDRAAAEALLPDARTRLTAAIAARSDAKGDVDKIDRRLRGIDIEVDRLRTLLAAAAGSSN